MCFSPESGWFCIHKFVGSSDNLSWPCYIKGIYFHASIWHSRNSRREPGEMLKWPSSAIQARFWKRCSKNQPIAMESLYRKNVNRNQVWQCVHGPWWQENCGVWWSSHHEGRGAFGRNCGAGQQPKLHGLPAVCWKQCVCGNPTP